MAFIPEIKATHYQVCGSVHAVNPVHARQVSSSDLKSDYSYLLNKSCFHSFAATGFSLVADF